MKKAFSIIVIAALTTGLLSSCKKDADPVPEPVSGPASISFHGNHYSYPKFHAAFSYDVLSDGYNIVLATENLGPIIADAIKGEKRIADEVGARTSARLAIDIPGSNLGQVFTLSDQVELDSPYWTFNLCFENSKPLDHFYCPSYNFRSGTMLVDLNRETGRLTINLDAVIAMEEGPDATCKVSFNGTAYNGTGGDGYIWSYWGE